MADDLLGEDVERIARDLRLLDRALFHALDDDRRLEQVGAELREDTAARHRLERVPGTPHPLEPTRDRLRRLDLDHEVDGAHVDPELERRRRDEAGDLAALQQLLDLQPLLARERPVVGARELFLGQLVEPERQPLGEPAVVDEDDRRPVLLDELEDLGVDRRPDRRRSRPLAAGAEDVGDLGVHAGLAHVLERHDDLQVELLRAAGVDELDRPAAGHELPDLLERPLGRREPDPLERVAREALEPLDAQRQVRAALRPGDGVHLVEDQRVDAGERLPGA